MAWHSWLTRERALRRLVKDQELLRVELQFLEQRSGFSMSAEGQAAGRLLDLSIAQVGGKRPDAEAAWASLHSARRYMLYGLSEEELAGKRRVLLIEKNKASGWRKEAIADLLKDAPTPTSHLCEAMAVLDEHSANKYHKIWMAADQLFILFVIAIAAMVLLVPMMWVASDATALPMWGFRMLSAVLFFGIEGGAFSVAQGIVWRVVEQNVPERTMTNWTMLVRAVFGSVAGLAGYTFYQANVFNVQALGNKSMAATFTVAFLFGYTGDRLIAGVANSFSPAARKGSD